MTDSSAKRDKDSKPLKQLQELTAKDAAKDSSSKPSAETKKPKKKTEKGGAAGSTRKSTRKKEAREHKVSARTTHTSTRRQGESKTKNGAEEESRSRRAPRKKKMDAAQKFFLFGSLFLLLLCVAAGGFLYYLKYMRQPSSGPKVTNIKWGKEIKDYNSSAREFLRESKNETNDDIKEQKLKKAQMNFEAVVSTVRQCRQMPKYSGKEHAGWDEYEQNALLALRTVREELFKIEQRRKQAAREKEKREGVKPNTGKTPAATTEEDEFANRGPTEE